MAIPRIAPGLESVDDEGDLVVVCNSPFGIWNPRRPDWRCFAGLKRQTSLQRGLVIDLSVAHPAASSDEHRAIEQQGRSMPITPPALDRAA
jgi:hypothetical protein